MAERTVLAQQVAGEILDQLRGSVISSSLPAHIGEWVRKTAGHATLPWTFSIPMAPPGYSLGTWWTLCPDGSIHLELRDGEGATFWRGTFEPVKEDNSGSGS